MKVYISGKITDDPDFIKKFNNAAEILEKAGHIVLNPVCYPNGLTWENYMQLSYAMIDCSEAVLMLKDWKDSKGATLAHSYARMHGKQIWYETTTPEPVKPQETYWNNICAVQQKQRAKGLKKYGMPLEQSPLKAIERLQYLEEELIDGLMYIEHIKALLNKEEVHVENTSDK